VTDLLDRLKSALADRYRIQRELGAGGMATVYLAEDLKHHRKVAVKVLRPELAATLGPERFLREIEVAAQLTHPHILPLHDSGEANGFLYYVMPYIEGESLRSKIARDRELPVPDAVRILREVVDALASAHKHGIVHRDIKPDNVLLAENHAVVTDFGVAKAVTEATGREKLTTAGVALGTPAYMAPEQASADPHIDHRVDIYAVGALGYELLAGRPPFTGLTAQEILSAHVTQAPVAVTAHRESVPPALAQLIMKCLEKKPADRWQSAAELLGQLEAVATPSGGTTPTEAVSAAESKRTRLPISTLAAAGVILALVASYLLLGSSGSRTAASAPEQPMLAVLPFENLGSPEDDYFSDGITGEIAGRLGRVSGLSVIASASAMLYKDTDKTIQQIGEELGVDYLLDGTIQWDKSTPGASRVRVSPELIRVSDAVQMWADPYDAVLEDIFGLQADVAEKVVQALGVVLLGKGEGTPEAKPTEDLEAYRLYLLGRQHWSRRTVADFDTAISFFRRSIERDSGYAQAWAGLANAYAVLPNYANQVDVRPADFYPNAETAVRKALELDSTLAEAHAALGFISLSWEWNWETAEEHYRRSIELDPDYATAHLWYALLLTITGRREEARAELISVLELDPVSVASNYNAGWCLWLLHDYDAAIGQFLKTIELYPNYAGAHDHLGRSYYHSSRLDEARSAWETTAHVREWSPEFLALHRNLTRPERRGAALNILNEVAGRPDGLDAFDSGRYYTMLGENDSAIAWLERYYEVRGSMMPYVGVYPDFDGLRSDPRFMDLLKRIGLDKFPAPGER
jgi:serine/threonine-protein kinase